MLEKPHRQILHQPTRSSRHDMKTSSQSLPGIMQVAYVPVERLQRHSDLKCLSRVPVEVFTTPTPIALKGEATCETVSQYDNNGRTEKTTLRFRTLDDIPTTRPVAFIVTGVNRQRYLVGLREAPYPVIKRTRTTGTPGGDPAVTSYEVAFVALKALIPLG